MIKHRYFSISFFLGRTVYINLFLGLVLFRFIYVTIKLFMTPPREAHSLFFVAIVLAESHHLWSYIQRVL